ncbi:uncharacterized protein [Antedon mediterranea]|uniref:uncharacterized protein n=1 Tax=Antedon mediterranea TaxID=105859 RepID=UPI003AF8DD93
MLPKIGPHLFNGFDDYLDFFQRRGLYPTAKDCSYCNVPMYMSTRNRSDGLVWRCHRCRRTIAMRTGTFLAGQKIAMDDWLNLVYYWATETSVKHAIVHTGLKPKVVIQQYRFLRDICSQKLLQTPTLLGGPGVVVQIDESCFSHSRKNGRGRAPEREMWVFGLVDTTTKPARGYLQFVEDRSAATLLPIIEDKTRPGTIIHSDMWAAYRQVVAIPGIAEHRTVNHSRHFVNPIDGTHTQNVESYWNKAKSKLKAMKGVKREWLSEYLDEFMWREEFGKDLLVGFENIIDHIAEIYPQA